MNLFKQPCSSSCARVVGLARLPQPRGTTVLGKQATTTWVRWLDPWPVHVEWHEWAVCVQRTRDHNAQRRRPLWWLGAQGSAQHVWNVSGEFSHPPHGYPHSITQLVKSHNTVILWVLMPLSYSTVRSDVWSATLCIFTPCSISKWSCESSACPPSPHYAMISVLSYSTYFSYFTIPQLSCDLVSSFISIIIIVQPHGNIIGERPWYTVLSTFLYFPISTWHKYYVFFHPPHISLSPHFPVVLWSWVLVSVCPSIGQHLKDNCSGQTTRSVHLSCPGHSLLAPSATVSLTYGHMTRCLLAVPPCLAHYHLVSRHLPR